MMQDPSLVTIKRAVIKGGKKGPVKEEGGKNKRGKLKRRERGMIGDLMSSGGGSLTAFEGVLKRSREREEGERER